MNIRTVDENTTGMKSIYTERVWLRNCSSLFVFVLNPKIPTWNESNCKINELNPTILISVKLIENSAKIRKSAT